jgi:TPP-dependent 2-oxoacid decarboxylase
MRPSAPDTVTLAEYLFTRLRQLGVEDLFGVPGDFNLALLDALELLDGPRWVGNANELGAAYAADGYARERGLAAVLTTYGVGELSALNGIAGSAAEQVPVLHLVGAPRTAAAVGSLPLHHTLLDGDFGHFQRASAEVSCAVAALTAAGDPAAEIDHVLQTMLDRSLPGYLSLPEDLVELPVSARGLATPLSPSPSDERSLARFAQAAATLLRGAEKVVLLAGAGVCRAHAELALRVLAQDAAIPVATLLDAKGAIPEDHPLALGVYQGALGAPTTREAVEGADVLICAGVRLSDVLTGGFSAQLDGPARIELGLDHVIVDGEPLARVRLLDGLTALRSVPREGTERGVADLHDELMRVLARDDGAQEPEGAVVGDPDAPLTHAVLWPTLASILSERNTVIADIGTSYLGIGAEALPAGARLIGQAVWSSIGYALPATLGVALADRTRRPVLLTGDGAAQMTVQELGTLAKRHCHPVILLVDNAGYTIEREIRGAHAAYNDITPWDWPALVHGLADASEVPVVLQATTGRELLGALRTAQARPDRLVLVQAHLDPHDVPASMRAMFGGQAAPTAQPSSAS